MIGTHALTRLADECASFRARQAESLKVSENTQRRLAQHPRGFVYVKSIQEPISTFLIEMQASSSLGLMVKELAQNFRVDETELSKDIQAVFEYLSKYTSYMDEKNQPESNR
jgi:hypothetical protein